MKSPTGPEPLASDVRAAAAQAQASPRLMRPERRGRAGCASARNAGLRAPLADSRPKSSPRGVLELVDAPPPPRRGRAPARGSCRVRFSAWILARHAGLFLLDLRRGQQLLQPNSSSHSGVRVAVGDLDFVDRAQRGEREVVEVHRQAVVVALDAGRVEGRRNSAVGADERARRAPARAGFAA